MSRTAIEPRGLSRESAAAKLRVSPEKFDTLVDEGKIPRPALLLGQRIWDAFSLFINHHPERSDRTEAVYVIGFGNYVKIGVSKNVHGRIFSIQEYAPEPLTTYKLFVGQDRRLEERLLKRFKPYRTRGEWFRLEGDLKEWVEAGCP